MTGCCCDCAAMTFELMYSNWASRSGCFEPSSALRLDWRENPSFTNSLRTVSALIGCPISVRAAASFSMLFDTQIKGRMGSKKSLRAAEQERADVARARGLDCCCHAIEARWRLCSGMSATRRVTVIDLC